VLQTAVKEVLHLPGEESADTETADSGQNHTDQAHGEQEQLRKHLTTSLYGPDETST